MYDFNVVVDKESSLDTVPVTITIDSFFFNPTNDNQNPPIVQGKYTTMLPCIYREVVSIELVHAIFPIANPNNPYVILKVNGLSRIESNNNNTRGSFALVYNDNQNDAHYRLKRAGSTPDDKNIYYFPEPVKLNKFDIEFVDPSNGATINSAANANHVLTFEVKCLNRAVKGSVTSVQ